MRDSEDEKTFGFRRDEESDDEIETNSWCTLMEEMESEKTPRVIERRFRAVEQSRLDSFRSCAPLTSGRACWE